MLGSADVTASAPARACAARVRAVPDGAVTVFAVRVFAALTHAFCLRS